MDQAAACWDMSKSREERGVVAPRACHGPSVAHDLPRIPRTKVHVVRSIILQLVISVIITLFFSPESRRLLPPAPTASSSPESLSTAHCSSIFLPDVHTSLLVPPASDSPVTFRVQSSTFVGIPSPLRRRSKVGSQSIHPIVGHLFP